MSLFQIGESFKTRYIYGNFASLALDNDGTLVTLGGSTPRGSVIEVTRLESDGSVISQNVVNTTTATNSPTGVELQVLSNGNLAALYHHQFRVFDANGEPITPMTDIPLTVFGSPTFTSRYWLSANPVTGGFSVIVGSDDTRTNITGEVNPGSNFSTRFGLQDVRIAEFDANGHLLRDPYFANYDGGDVFSWMGAQIAARHTTLPDGRVVIAYTDQFYNVVSQPANGTVFSGMGISFVILKDGVREAERAVYVPPLDDKGWGFIAPQSSASNPPVVVPSSLGGFAVLYAAGGTWWARFYDGSNTVASDPILLSGVSGVGTGNGPPLVAMMSGGRIAVVSANPVGLSAGDINLTVFDHNGVIDFIHVATVPGGNGVTTFRDLVIGDDETIYVSVGGSGPETVYRFGLSEGIIVPGLGGNASGTGGNDVIIGGAEDNRLVGRNGSDRLEGQKGADTLLGGNGNDHLQGNDGNDILDGGDGNDSLRGGAGDDTITGGKGDDQMRGGSGVNALDGGDGQDTADYGDQSAAVIVKLNRATAADVTIGGALAGTVVKVESVIGGSADDRLTGDSLRNTLSGLWGNDVLTGGANDDRLLGGAGRDRLVGGSGKDTLSGDNGADRLIGGKGIDTVEGGAGSDVFVLSNLTAHRDIIQDFDVLDDQLEISAALFGGGLVAGTALAARAFVTNTTGLAGDANDRFIFNSATNELFYDADGTGAGAAQLIAEFAAAPTGLSASDFDIV